MKISARARAVQPSATLAITAKAKALKEQGKDVVGLGAGEPDLDTPAHVKAAGIAAIEQGFTRYTPTGGIPELKRAIVAKHARENELSCTEAEVLVSVGAKHSLYNLFQALLDPGDEVVIFAPYWVSYPDMVTLAGGTPVIVPTRAEDGFAPTPEALRAALTKKTVAVIFNSPSNPTGAVFPRATLRALADVLLGHETLVVTDDIYEHLVYGEEKFCNILNVEPKLRERCVVVNGLSKSFSMTGWRIGWAVGPRELIAAMQRIQDQSTSNATSISQKAAVAALTGGNAFVDDMRAKYDERRRYVERRLAAIPGVKCPPIAGAFYAFPDVSALLAKSHEGVPLEGKSQKLAELLLERYGVAMIPGAPFGAEGFIRLSFAASMAELERGLDRFEACARALQ